MTSLVCGMNIALPFVFHALSITQQCCDFIIFSRVGQGHLHSYGTVLIISVTNPQPTLTAAVPLKSMCYRLGGAQQWLKLSGTCKVQVFFCLLCRLSQPLQVVWWEQVVGRTCQETYLRVWQWQNVLLAQSVVYTGDDEPFPRNRLGGLESCQMSAESQLQKTVGRQMTVKTPESRWLFYLYHEIHTNLLVVGVMTPWDVSTPSNACHSWKWIVRATPLGASLKPPPPHSIFTPCSFHLSLWPLYVTRPLPPRWKL